jgi:glycosyltransferase involved in cell wall biosynthesis
MRILFVSWWFPYPPDNGSRIRIFNLLKQLASRHTVTLLTFSDDPERDTSASTALAPYCTDVQIAHRVPFIPGRWRALRGLLSPQPRTFVETYSPRMRRLVEERVKDTDLVIVSEFWTVPYALELEYTPVILEDLEIAPFYEGDDFEPGLFWRLRYQLMWWKHKKAMRRAALDFDGVTVVSDREQTLIEEIVGQRCPIAIVPNGVDLGQYQDHSAAPETNKLIFPGALTFFANYGAMDWFLRHTYPLIQAEVPDVRLDITGGTKGVDLDALPQRDGVTFTGYLPDVRPAVAGSWACVVPLQVGGGTRLKILEALAVGTPVVSTSKGAEGLDLRPGQDLLIADEPTDFAGQTVRLLRDPALRAHLAANGRRAVERYAWSAIGSELDRFLEKVARIS